MNKGIIAFFFLVAAGGFAVAHYWDEIRIALEFEESSEDRALEIAKSDRSLVRHRTNHKALQDVMEASEGIEVIGWQVDAKSDQLFLVKFLYRQNGKPGGYYFEVNLATQDCCNIEEYSELAERYGVTPSTPE